MASPAPAAQEPVQEAIQQSAPEIAEAPQAAHVPAAAEGVWAQQRKTAAVIYWGIHAACLLALYTGVSALDLALCFGLYYLRLLAITGAYHRYFSHRSFKTSRAFQLVMAVVGCTAVQKGPLWWAAGHRRHHRYSDHAGDMHSPRDGFWYSHQLWILDGRWERTETERIPDLTRYPELVWLNRWHVVPALLLAVGCLALGGLSGLVWGFAISTSLLWHSTYTINSLAHRWGSQRYETGDDSRNNVFLALLTLGEGWHNNHHKFQSCARQGFFWWEVDITYYVLKGLERVGLVWELREPPERLLQPGSFSQATPPA